MYTCTRPARAFPLGVTAHRTRASLFERSHRNPLHRGCTRAGYYEEGTFAEEYGDAECLVDIGCWGPVVQCNIVSRGAINGVGGCMKTGGVCIGCTMPGFPDKFSPFYKTPPGTMVSGTATRLLGSFIRPLRRLTQSSRNLTTRWEKDGVPSTWGIVNPPSVVQKVNDFFYDKLRFFGGTRPKGDGGAS